MKYTFSFSKQFAKEFKHLNQAQRDKITTFLSTYQTHGLQDFSEYEGKITPSWKGEHISPTDYSFAKKHNLWHYHVGYPDYQQRHPKYKTSEWLLHFQWEGQNIHLVDLYVHYLRDGSFYLPPGSSLE